MAIKLFDTKDAVPEAQREAAIETRDGKWAADDGVDPAAGLKTALESERTARRASDTALAALRTEVETLKRDKDAKDKGVTEEQLQKIRDEEKAGRKPLEDELAQLRAENLQLKHTDRLRAAAIKAGVMEDRLDDAMLVLERRTKLDDKGGIVVIGKDGQVSGEALEGFLGKTFKEEKPYFYRGTGSSGSGSEGSDGGGGDGDDAKAAVAAGKAAAAEQKKTAAEGSLAFR